MGKMKAHQQNQDWMDHREERRLQKQEMIKIAREALNAKGYSFTEHNESFHFIVMGTYHFYPSTGLYKHKKWVSVRGRGLESLLNTLETEKMDKVTFSFCPRCKSKYPHRSDHTQERCNRCINKDNAEEQRQRRAAIEAARVAIRDAEKIEFVADWDTPCTTCEQVPSIKGHEMCAVCTFGEAQAQQDLIEGKL